ncbi:MAG: hypothetical protein GF320_16895 [Armatimonadia bacterium]|nr:hypothetical protein [Armatimonadia bacterium]
MGARMLAMAACAMAFIAAPAAKGEPVLIEDVGPYEVVEPLYEAARLALNARGEEYTASYIQGISGAAFAIGGICPCAPTSTTDLWPDELVRTLGYECEQLDLGGRQEGSEEHLPALIETVKAEIDAGRPVPVWHAFTTAEWDIVIGYDDETEEFIGYGSYAGDADSPARAPMSRMNTAWEICPAYGILTIGDKTGELDETAAEIGALKKAVLHARKTKDLSGVAEGEWCMLDGIQCYDRWTHQWRSDPERVPEAGDSYCLGILAAVRPKAADFLRQIAAKYPAAEARLFEAAREFDREAEALEECFPHLWWEASRSPDPLRNEEAARLLGVARNHYAAGIERIEDALEAMGESAPEQSGTARPGARPPVPQGNGYSQSHFALTVLAACEHFGIETSYGEILALSTNAFAPCMDPRENCTAWWMEFTGRDRAMGSLAPALGLQAKPIDPPLGAERPPEDAEDPVAWMKERRAPMVEGVRSSLAHHGSVVLTRGFWRLDGPHGFIPWSWYGLITEVTEDDVPLGATLNGHADNPIAFLDGVWTLEPHAKMLTQPEIDRRLLELAVERIRGEGLFEPSDSEVFGLEAVERWADQMERVPYCEACQEDCVGCAMQSAWPVYDGAKVAASHLRAMALRHADAADHLGAAAARYDAIAAILEGRLDGEGEASYGAIMNNLEAQVAHAGELRELRKELAAAAEEMTAAALTL